MQRKQYLLLILSIILLGAAGFTSFQLSNSRTNGEAGRLNVFLKKQENLLLNYSQKDNLRRHLLGFGKPNEQYPVSSKNLEKLQKQDFNLFLLRRDSLVFWSKPPTFIPAYLSHLKGAKEARWLVQRPEGDFAVWARLGGLPETGPFHWLAVIPLHQAKQGKTNSLKYRPTAYQNSLELGTEKSDFPIEWSDGTVLCYARNNPPHHSGPKSILILLAYLPGLFVLGWLMTTLARMVSRKTTPWLGAVFLIIIVLALRSLAYWLGFGENLNHLFLFQDQYTIPLNEKPIDFLINTLLLLWVVLFLHDNYRPQEKEQALSISFLLTILNYFLVFATLGGLTIFTRFLIFHNPISFAGSSPFDLGWGSLLALTALVLLFLSFFLLAYRLLLFVDSTEMPLTRRSGALLIAVVLFSIPAFLFFQTEVSPLIMISAGFVFIFLFEVFNRTGMGLNFFWFLIWILLLSGYSGFLIFKFDNQKSEDQRIEFVQKLIPMRDSIAEVEIRQLITEVKQKNTLGEMIRQFPDSLMPDDSIYSRLRQHFQEREYLFSHYNYQPYLFRETNRNVPSGQSLLRDALRFPLNRQVVISFPEIRFGFDKQGLPVYRVEMGSQVDSTFKLTIQFRPRQDAHQNVYVRQSTRAPYQGLEGLQKFRYFVLTPSGIPIIKSDEEAIPRSVEKEGAVPGKHWNIRWEDSEYTFLADQEGYITIVGGQQNSYMKFISMTSLIFALILIAILILNLIHLLVRILPQQLNLILAGAPSMRRRVQSAFIWLTIIFFAITGPTTIFYFGASREEYTNAQVKQKRDAVLENLKIELGQPSIPQLQSLLPKLSSIHHVNLHLYSDEGRLIQAAGEAQIPENPILMNPLAFHLLANGENSGIILSEKPGSSAFTTSYESIFKENAPDQLIGFLGIPFYAEQQEIRSDLNQFLGTLLNAYVFLFLIAAAISVFFSNNLTDGITQIGEKMRAFKLGGKNEPLGWKRKDEVGALVEEYNKMIDKLEESAVQLAQSEREDAWREMAKQIAHEIKNPLTPMRLRVQQLTRIYEADPHQLEERLKSTSASLIEQIESLAQIANEFSAFAKMPDPVNERVELNQLVKSVVNLFEDEENADLYMYLPKDQLVSFVDKKQLVRVLNNLIKNAIQAIPEERRGDIGIHLFQREDKAIIMVEDNGTGIPEDKQDKVFVPNFTTKSSGKGLGLAIARNVVAAAKGKIYFETEKGKGTKFFVELPLMNN
jgi:two-component system nitrogen regulation sensor histidine kinase NtrY